MFCKSSHKLQQFSLPTVWDASTAFWLTKKQLKKQQQLTV